MEQTVGPPASFRRNGGAPSSHGEGAQPGSHEDSTDALLTLLPVHSARELVTGLAAAWQKRFEAESIVVAAAWERLRRKLVCRFQIGVLPEVSESPYSTDTAADFPGCFAADPLIATAGRPDLTLPLPVSADARAGVFLYGIQRRDATEARVETFCAISGRLVDQAALVEARRADEAAFMAAKAAALAEFAAGAGHEINNPLGTIAGRVQMLLRDETDANRRQKLATIGAQALRIRDMIGDLMLYARPPVPTPERLPVNEVAQSIVERFLEPARSRGRLIGLRSTGPIWAWGDRTQFSIVISEMIRNSLEAIDSRGEVGIGLARSMIGGRGYSVVSISDDGRGLTERDRAHLFDPFYSGRQAGRGLGFGLCKCSRIVAQHGGWIEVDSVPNVSTTFRVFWPEEPGSVSSITG